MTSVNEEIETAKRKSEDAEEPDKSRREKRRRGDGGKKLRPGGLRKVYPYYFDFRTYCKGRWIGKSLLEVFSSEFRAESLDYYKAAAKEGRIKLNEIPIEDLSITLRNNDHMRNTVHRHEPPVVGQPLKVLVDDGQVLVVDKPASMPVHPCGRFRHNTVIFILGKERGITELHTVHRLDRLTSGVLLFARTLEMSQKLDILVRERKMEKEYVCRVEGKFPEGELVCEEPILVVSFKVGLCRVDPKGKECRTVFQRLSYNGTSSVVRCLPLTGRTHQIRVHLQFLGFPILHDPIYGSCAWGPHRAKGGLVGMSDDELLNALMAEHRSKESLYLLDLPDDGVGMTQEKERTVPGTHKQAAQRNGADGASKADEAWGLPQTEKSEVTQGSRVRKQDMNSCDRKESEVVQIGNLALNSSGSCPTQNSDKGTSESNCLVPEPTTPTDSCKQVPSGTRDSLCSECKLVRPDPTEKELIMYLHALRYKGPDFEYSTPQPDWAKEDWIED
ncbi:pseudouridylate synthase RPUSD2 [Aplochiton taeniatus]